MGHPESVNKQARGRSPRGVVIDFSGLKATASTEGLADETQASASAGSRSLLF